MRFFKWLMKIFGYLVYTLVVLVVMLWYQFPHDAARTRLESELHRITPGLQWKIGGIGLAPPVDLRLTDIKISEPSDQKTPLLSIDALSLRPDLPISLQEKKLAAGYQLDMLDGVVIGELILDKDYTTVQYEGNASGLKISGLKKIMADLGRTVTGTLSASFSGKGNVRGPFVGELNGMAMLAKGDISFQGPVLGMQQLAFDQVTSQITYRPGQIHLKEGKVESRLLDADFAGTVRSVDPIGSSVVNLKGSLSPRSEFLSGIGDQAAVDVLKKQLKEGKLSFSINGALVEPGIVFAGLPPEFNQQLLGGGK